MEQFLDPQQQGFWLLMQEGQLWLPGGELPHGEASSWGLPDNRRRPSGSGKDKPYTC